MEIFQLVCETVIEYSRIPLRKTITLTFSYYVGGKRIEKPKESVTTAGDNESKKHRRRLALQVPFNLSFAFSSYLSEST